MATIKLEADSPIYLPSFPSPANQMDVKQEGPERDEADISAAVSAFDDEQFDEPPPATHLPQLVTDISNSADLLESAVRIGVRVIDDLVKPLRDHASNEDAAAFIQSLGDLRSRAVPTRTVVGVVGNTGAGKSSVINALLDEERLLPTNGMRACTASPTEISYNYSDDPTALYEAEVEFITADDWIRELRVLFSDLLAPSGEISREATTADTDAGIAYAKLRAVYPQKTREMLATGSPEAFARETRVRNVLGTVKSIKQSSAPALYQQLQRYVDSKEKTTDTKRAEIDMEFWPLIKVVRIHTKAVALSTGAVIVDLPGVHDSNAARAAVAENYMKACTGLWIVAPITRAVDDKTAKNLLGDAFKRQLKFDGIQSAVSFICSKTDDISITEAAESLNMEEEVQGSWERAEDLKKQKDSLKRELVDWREAKAVCGEKLDECEAKIDVWEDLDNNLRMGMTIYAPREKKRKRQDRRPKPSRKNLVSSDVESIYSDSDDGSDKENSQASQASQNRTPLTEEDITDALDRLRTEKKALRGERRGADKKMAEIRGEMAAMETERESLLAEVKAACIKGRNEYSRGAIKQDFAMGVKELDQENAAEDDENFDPEVDLRDYDEVARNLPVFCVSSRAYQKLSGNLRKDDFQDQGFMSPEDTEIPQLQEHAKKLTEVGRSRDCRRFLNDLDQLVSSMLIWSTDDGTRSTLTDVEKRREETHLKRLLNGLEKTFHMAARELTESIQLSLQEHIFECANQAIPTAINAAVETASRWGAHRSQGGLCWSTYKATCRRNGVFNGTAGHRDFNEELFEPVSRQIATGWERAFQRRVPGILACFAAKSRNLLNGFHTAAVARAKERRTNVAGMTVLVNQTRAYSQTLADIPTQLTATITELQREASRAFTPLIGEAMTQAYEICTEERGPGSYARMKAAMVSHVDGERRAMFRRAVDMVEGQLDDMCAKVESQMRAGIQDVFNAVYRDYMTVLIGAGANNPQHRMPHQERELRGRITSLLQAVDGQFAFVQPNLDPAWTLDRAPSAEDKVQAELRSAHGSEYGDDKTLDADAHDGSQNPVKDDHNRAEPNQRVKDDVDDDGKGDLGQLSKREQATQRARQGLYDDSDDDDDIPSFETVFGRRT